MRALRVPAGQRNFMTSLNPTATTARPHKLDRVGHSPSASTPTRIVKPGTSAEKVAPRPAPSTLAA